MCFIDRFAVQPGADVGGLSGYVLIGQVKRAGSGRKIDHKVLAQLQLCRRGRGVREAQPEVCQWPRRMAVLEDWRARLCGGLGGHRDCLRTCHYGTEHKRQCVRKESFHCHRSVVSCVRAMSVDLVTKSRRKYDGSPCSPPPGEDAHGDAS